MQKLYNRPASLIALALILFFAANIIADRYLRPVNVDLTDGGLYTLSNGTYAVAQELEEPVTLEFYFSKRLAASYPNLLNYGKRVEDVLNALARELPGKIILRTIEPAPFSESEDRAVEAGLSGAPLGDGSTLYLGLRASNTLDGEAVIPFFSEEREQFLEYDLAKLIQSLNAKAKPKLTLLTSLPMVYGPGGAQAAFQGRSQPYMIYEQLQEFFTLEEINSDFKNIPTDTDILMIAHPPVLNNDQLFAIDQYALSGGRMMLFLDPHAEAVPSDAGPGIENSSNLDPLLKAWGVEIPTGQIVADAKMAQRVQFADNFGRPSVKDYLVWLDARTEFLNTNDIATGSVENLSLASAGAINKIDGHNTQLTPIITSSTDSALIPVDRILGTPDPDALLREFETDGQPKMLAARITGRAKSAYPDRAQQAALPEGRRTEGNVQIVLFADSDMLADRFWVQVQDLFGQRLAVPIAGNGSLLLNIADHFAGSDALLSLRGRGISRRPFTVVDDLRRAAEATYLAEEERLNKELEETEARLAELEAVTGNDAILSPAQEAEIDRFRASAVETRKELRAVQRSLREDIDALGTRLAAINILAVPVLLVFVGMLSFWRRRNRLRKLMKQAH